MTDAIVLQGSGRIRGDYVPPGDKSISHRAVMFGALGKGRSIYRGFLKAEDCLHTAEAFRRMGVKIALDPQGLLVVDGVGVRGLQPPGEPLFLGNSGTSMRLLLGILAAQRFETILTGDPSLSARPMSRVTQPLKRMGAQIKGRDHGNFAPLTIHGGRLRGIDYENELRSAQVKSAVLLAGLFAEGQTRVRETSLARDHTERFLIATGARFRQEGPWLTVEKSDSLRPLEAFIPGDLSSAAFFIVAAAMFPGSELTVRGVGLNPTRTGLLKVLERMGARIQVRETVQSPEPMGEIYVQGVRLKGTRVAGDEIPSLIDELPILMTAMALAEGESIVSGAEELRVKETDRILSMVQNLNALGGRLQELPDGCVICGVPGFKAAPVKSFGDHRTAMSMAVASLAMSGDLTIEDVGCVATSYPGFFQDFHRLRF